jgi:hypothetical protein
VVQLKHLFENFNEVDAINQRRMVAAYRLRRAEEFTQAQNDFDLAKQAKKTRKRTPALKLSAEEKILIKKLGITQTQLRAMKAAQGEPNGS